MTTTTMTIAVAVNVAFRTAVLAGCSHHGRSHVSFTDADLATLSPAARQLLADAYHKPSSDGLFTVVYPVLGKYGYEPLSTAAATVAAVSAALEDLACRRRAALAAIEAKEAAVARLLTQLKQLKKRPLLQLKQLKPPKRSPKQN